MSSPQLQQKGEELLALLASKLGAHLLASRIDLEYPVIWLRPEEILDVVRILKLDSDLQFNLLVDITVVDWLDSRPDRYELVYHFTSLVTGDRLRVKVDLKETACEIESITSLYAGANYMECEAWDMYGVRFRNHPDLRRILMYDEFVGHPLRKDYPVQAKQPRVKMLHPEVRNTAMDMQRPELVRINPRHKKKSGAVGGVAGGAQPPGVAP